MMQRSIFYGSRLEGACRVSGAMRQTQVAGCSARLHCT